MIAGLGAGVSWALDGESGFNVRFDGLADGWELDAETAAGPVGRPRRNARAT